jgi:hypothetical protein
MLPHHQRSHHRRIRQTRRELDSASYPDHDCPVSDSCCDIRSSYACNEMTRGAVFQPALLVALFRCSRAQVGRLAGVKRRRVRKAVPLGKRQALFSGTGRRLRGGAHGKTLWLVVPGPAPLTTLAKREKTAQRNRDESTACARSTLTTARFVPDLLAEAMPQEISSLHDKSRGSLRSGMGSRCIWTGPTWIGRAVGS